MGIDENGLGPRLGPLVVTAVSALCADAPRESWTLPRRGLRSRLDDSKRLVSYRDNALGEAWARAIARRMGRVDAASPDAVIATLSIDNPGNLRAPCPIGHADQCWGTRGEDFCATPELVALVEEDLAGFDARGATVNRAVCAITCVRRLHEADARGFSRLHVDLHAMERLAHDARRHSGCDVDVTCGKVGGYDCYQSAFGPTRSFECTPLVEGRARSEYAINGLGRIAFVRDADGSHPLVAMASLVGKWVRDVLMARVVRHYRDDDDSLPDASGYNDTTTTRFIEGTRPRRELTSLPRECFERPGRR